MSEQSEVPILNEEWAARNWPRVRIVSGLLMVATSGLALTVDAYVGAVLHGVFGGLLLGGWPALRRLVFGPRRWQLRQYYHILVDTRRLEEFPHDERDKYVTVMRPYIHGWREVLNR